MNHIHITHNPFTVETEFLINGTVPSVKCSLMKHKSERLQLWIENLFDELSHYFNGDNTYDITFTGVESDYLDLCAAAEMARAQGMQAELNWEEKRPPEERLEYIRHLVEEAREHPQIEQFFCKDERTQQELEEAFNRDFDVYVVATMSSGKSTLINAMLGHNLLPAALEATTATITRITDNDAMERRFSAKRIDLSGEVIEQNDEVTLETLKEWNALTDDTLRIDIEGDIVAIRERENVRLVLTDTPGPNNSANEKHKLTTMSFIQDSRRNPLILYVLNATNLGVNDDQSLLKMVAEYMNKGGKQGKDRFIFVVNKMDEFDPDNTKGGIPGALDRVKKYLENNGINNPIVYPVSANITRLIRIPTDKQTPKERSWFSGISTFFEEEPRMNLMQYMPITSKVKSILHEKKLSPLMLSSGLPAVEAMIDEYIEKYNLPHRIKRAYDTLRHVIEKGLNESQVMTQLEQDEHALAHLKEEIQHLEERKAKGFDSHAYKDKLEREGKTLPEATEQELTKLEGELEPLMRELGNFFLSSDVSPQQAKNKIADANKRAQFQYLKLVNAYEALFENSQTIIRADLIEDYQTYITSLFSDSRDLQLPILEGIRKTLGDISFNLNLSTDHIKTRQVKTGSYQVSDSTWYKPWSWFSTRTENTYKDEKYVDMRAVWKDYSVTTILPFDQLILAAREQIDTGKNTLIDQFLAFMNEEFDEKFHALMNDLKEKTTNQQKREEAIKKAKELVAWLEDFRNRLDTTLSF